MSAVGVRIVPSSLLQLFVSGTDGLMNKLPSDADTIQVDYAFSNIGGKF
jgi:hypothetical protein